ncbi:MAG: hypothetical protein AAF666_12715 [Pseudomonadota bacterium]
MRPGDFRAFALARPEPDRAGHTGKVELRERKMVFGAFDAEPGTLKPDADQHALMIDLPGDSVFPADGAWGAKRWTGLHPSRRDAKAANPWIRSVWTDVAPEAHLKAAA